MTQRLIQVRARGNGAWSAAGTRSMRSAARVATMLELDFCGLAALHGHALCECLDAAGVDGRLPAPGRDAPSDVLPPRREPAGHA